jgi:ketosteroid isomerase-like protein
MELPDDSLALARRFIASINGHDETSLRAILGASFLYSAMVRNPPEMAMRWDTEQFLGIVKSTAGNAGSGWRKPVIHTIVSEWAAGNRAVVETEGYSERDDGYVYANVYCFNFWTEGGKIKAIHDYCCTHTAVLLGQHIRAAMAKPG